MAKEGPLNMAWWQNTQTAVLRRKRFAECSELRNWVEELGSASKKASRKAVQSWPTWGMAPQLRKWRTEKLRCRALASGRATPCDAGARKSPSEPSAPGPCHLWVPASNIVSCILPLDTHKANESLLWTFCIKKKKSNIIMMTVVRKSGSMSSASRRRPDLAHLSGRTSVTAEPRGLREVECLAS